MQAQTNYTTQLTARFWFRWGARALAALLIFAVVSVGLLYALGLFGQGSRGATDDSVAPPARPLVTYCRVCQDEVLAARQRWQPELEPGRAASVSASPARSRIETCRVCRDEVLEGKEPSAITPAYEQPSLDTSDPHQRGPR